MTTDDTERLEERAERLRKLTPEQRALLAQRLRRRSVSAEQVAGQEAGEPLRLSYAQERMWLLNELTPGMSAYNTARVVRLDGPVDAALLRDALAVTVRDHAVLRTRVDHADDGQPVARIAEPGPVQLEIAEARDGDTARDLVRAFITRPFDLGREDLLRALLVRLDDGRDWLALSLHHIASDEASRGILWAYLDAAYAGRELPPLGLPYATLARRQRRELEGGRIAEEVEWWREHLAGAPSVLDLPIDHVRPRLQSYRGHRIAVPLDPDLVTQLRSFAAERGTTPFVAVAAAFAWLVSRWGRTDDLVLGMPVSGRGDPDARGVIGLFVNTVVVRTDCADEPSYAGLVERLRVSMLASLSHQELPFEKVVEAVAPSRDLSRNPLFQVAINSVSADGDDIFQLGGLRAEAVQVDPDTTKYDVGLLVHEDRAGGMRLVLEHSVDLFDQSTMDALLDELLTLVRRGLATSDRPLTSLDLMSPEQRTRLVETVNDTGAPFPGGCVHDAIQAQARRTPGAIAVADEISALTYAELDARANQLAHHLVGMGVGPGVLVAVAVPRSLAMEVALVAILKAGGAYLPLDVTYPGERLAFMLEDSAAAVVLTDRSARDRLPDELPEGVVSVMVDDLDEVLAGMPVSTADAPPDTGVTPDDLCYVIYTSGSTGRPKGAELRHRGVVNRLDWMQRTFGLTGDDTVLQKTPLSFDVSAWEVLWPVMVGARLFMARPDGHRDPAYLVDTLVRHDVTVLHFVPSMLAAFLGSLARGDLVGSRVRAVVCSGEALTHDVKEQFFARLPEVELHNLYGPTEASIDVTWHRCRPGPAHPVRIGRPISNVCTFVLDTHGRPVPVGVPGELYLSGVQLARGYLGRPELTAERFVPLDLAPDGRAYRTGDLVRWTAAGELDYLGRLDDQVKLRGFRIELGEIEALLAGHHDVTAACAAIVDLPSGEPVLAAYVVVDDRSDDASGEPSGAPSGDQGRAPEPGATSHDDASLAGPAPGAPELPRWFAGEERPTDDEVRSWVEATAQRLSSLVDHAHVLELGTGSGLLPRRLAAESARWVAVDPSETAVARLESLLTDDGLGDRVRTVCAPMAAVSPATLGGAMPSGGFDLVVVNSITHRFQDRDHVADVLAAARGVLRPGGRIFVGDVVDVRLHRALAHRVEVSRQQGRRGRPSPAALRLCIEDRLLLDTQLLLAPEFFAEVAPDLHLQALPRTGQAPGEVEDFRYDVVLSDLGPGGARRPRSWSEWDSVNSIVALDRVLASAVDAAARDGVPPELAVRGIPDARTASDVAELARLDTGREDRRSPADAVHPDRLVELAERHGLSVELSVLEDGARLAASFGVDRAPVRFVASTDRPAGPKASDPVGARRRAEIRTRTVRALADLARARLPDYMVPTSIRAVPGLPLGLSGKLDRAALPVDLVVHDQRAVIAPRTELERDLLGIWRELLGVDEAGVEDDFFRLGGHSLLAVKVLSAVSRAFGVRLPLASMFATPTVVGLAAEVERARAGAAGPLDVIQVADHARARRLRSRLADPAALVDALAGRGEPDNDADVTVVPLSRAQQRMWFLDALEEGRPVYSVRRAYRVTGPADPGAVADALDLLVRRHAALRTLVLQRGDVLAGLVADDARWPLERIDVSHEPDPGSAARDHARQVAARPFDLESGPLAQAYWYDLATDDALLVLRLHHLLVDGWALDVIMRELRTLCAARTTAAPITLPDVVQYPDVVVWEQQRDAAPELDRDLDYWRERLAGAPAALELPTDRPRPPEPTSAGRRVSLALGRLLTDQVRSLAREHGATPFAVLATAVAALLARLSGQDDIVVGTAVAGRRRAEVEHTVGLFANTLLLRTDASGDPTFVDLLDQAQATIVAAQDHQDLPFERLVEELSPERELGRNPLFQVLVNLVPSGHEDLRLGEAVLTPYELETPFTRFDLGFTFAERADGLVATLEYRSDLYDPPTIERMLERLEAILRLGTSVPEARLHELPLLTEEEQRAVRTWGTDHRRGAPTSALELVAAQVAADPGRVAVVSPGRDDLSYAELWRRAGLLAARIRADCGRGTTVGLLTSRDDRLVVGALAAWRAGCSYLPLDAAHPEERRRYCLDDAGATFVITDHVVDTACADGVQSCGDLPAVTPGDLAYLIYTSGSTGRPKGVEIEHGSLANLLLGMAETVGFTRDDAIAAVTTFSFDMAVPEVWLPLTTGARVVMLPLEVSTDPDRLAAALTRYDVSVLQATPSRWRMLLAGDWTGRQELKALCGGEAITPDLADALRSRVGELWNCYGPTETTVWSTLGRLVEPGDVSVGRPIRGTTLYVCDPRGWLVPPGTTGELWIGGSGVARGYHGRPDLTADRFEPDPWQPGGRMYRTGDLAMWTPDGRLRCLGRTDAQVKLRGHRIELGEVESVATSVEGVREAAVVLREDVPGDPRLVAYVVGSSAGVLDALRARLPAYMIPSAIVELDSLPRTTSHKIDRNALPAPGPVITEGTAPATDTEKAVARIWAELLDVEAPHLEDDFFAAGGHSLMATRLTGRLSSVLGTPVALRTVFEHPTLGALAAALAEPPARDFVDAQAGPHPVSRAGRRLRPEDLADRGMLEAALADRSSRSDGSLLVWPMSAAQQRMWLLHELAPTDPSYHVSVLRRVRGPVEPDRLDQATHRLVARHELLRTTYVQHDDLWVQVVHEPAAMPPVLRRLDLRGLAPDDVVRAVRREASAPFDLAAGPVLRVVLAEVGTDEWLLLLVQHHIAVDGWSLGLLLSDLSSFYSGDDPGEPLLQFGDYVVWDQARGADRADAEHWRTVLAGAPEESTFPSAVERTNEAPRGRRVRHSLGAATSRRVAEVARAHGATPFMVLAAAVSGLLARHGTGPDVVLGTPVATRSFAGGEHISGPLINTLALRLTADDTRGFGDHLEGVARACRDAYAHQDHPFERLVSELNVPRSATRHPLFQVLVSLQEDVVRPVQLDEATLEPVEMDWHTARVDASFAWTLRAGRIDLVLEYREDRYGALGEWLADRFERLLVGALADPARPLADLPYLGAQEEQALAAWATVPQQPDLPLLPDLVRGIADADPDRPAVELQGRVLSYGELVTASDVLAGRMAAAGVSTGDTVALVVGHDPVWPVAALASWRLGAAWVPVDPDYPLPRRTLMIRDSGSVVVVVPASSSHSWEDEVDVPVVRSDPSFDARQEPPALDDRACSADDTAYLIYTSGSTGTPKAARAVHRGLAALTAGVRDRFWGDLDPAGRRVGLFSAVIFDFSVLQLVNLGSGATLVLVPDELRRDPRAVVSFVGDAGLAALDVTPTHLRVLLEEGLEEQGGLQRLLVGGEAVEQDLWDRLRRGTTPVLNLYGPTEFTVCATAADVHDSPVPTLGRPLPGVRTRVVDDAGRDRPVGVPGELLLGGDQVGNGYHGRPELTAQRFPVHGDGRWYRTGDLVVASRDGSLAFLGRIDDQVKVRGFRIEPGEVAEALRRRPSVADAVVVVEEGQLVGYVRPAAGHPWQPAELRHDLRAELPAHMVPATLVEVKSIPLMANGKLDRSALRELPRRAEGDEIARGRAPSGPAEELIAEIWSDLLGLTDLTAEDDFFDLGGDSLSASRFIGRLRELDLELPLVSVFAAPTLAEVARRVTDLLLHDVNGESSEHLDG